MILVRKYTPAKWKSPPNFPRGALPADAVTADLRTTHNTLSFWKCESIENDGLDGPALAIAAGKERLETIDLVWLPQKDFLEEDLTLQQTKGKTPVESWADRHFDVTCLDYVRLGKIAHRVAAAIKNLQCRRFPRKAVANLLMTAVREQRVNPDDLKENVRSKIKTL